MRFSGTGAKVGAGIGAVARSAVLLINSGGKIPLLLLLPSAAIGVLVGGIAGGTGRPLLGAVLGAFLSAVVFELVMFSCFSSFGAYRSETFLKGTLIYALQMGAAGALAGGIGGNAGRAEIQLQSRDLLDHSQSETKSDQEHPES